MVEWISVKERLPDRLEYVLLSWDGFQFQPDAFYDYKQKKWQNILSERYEEEEVIGDPIRSITHWMPLPEVPSVL